MKQWKETERFKIEAAIYDSKAKELLQHIEEKDLFIDSKEFPFPNRDHVDFVTYALTRLGRVDGKKLLDCGCGTGASTIFFAKNGARVTGVDISRENIRISQLRIRINSVEDQSEFHLGPIELLDYENQYFDLIFGNQILHHLNLRKACANLRRMLKRGGKAVFCEPVFFLGEGLYQMRNSRLGKTLIPHRADTPTESSLSIQDLQILSEFFEKVQYRGFHLLTRLTNWIQINDKLHRKICKFDAFIMEKLTFARRLSHFVVLELE